MPTRRPAPTYALIGPMPKSKKDQLAASPPLEVLPDLTEIQGLDFEDAFEVLSDKQNTDLHERLQKMAQARRQAEADSAAKRLS